MMEAKERLRNFKPHPSHNGKPSFQERFFKSIAKVRLICAGNQSGKTTVGAAEFAMLCLGEHPYKKSRTPSRSIIVTAKSHKDGIEDEILPKLMEVVGSDDIVRVGKDKQGRPSTIYWRSKSITHLMSAEQDDVAFESKTTDVVWIDEPVRRSIYIALRRGLMKSGGLLFITSTPLEEPWMYEDIYLRAITGDKNYEVFEGSTDENPHIPEKEREDFFSSLTPDEIEARRYGKFTHMTGRVFKTYKKEIHLIEGFDIPHHFPVWVAIDPHPQKPHAVVYVAASPQGILYVCNEIYRQCSIEDLAQEILEINSQYNVVDILIDTSSQQDGWDKVSARQILEDCGVSTRLAQKKNLKRSGIILVNQLFQKNKLFVFNNCARVHRELTLQIYEKNKRDPQKMSEIPMKKFDDCTDAIRYILVENPEYSGIAREIQYA